MSTPDELLEEMEAELAAADYGLGGANHAWRGASEIDRRHFIFASLVTAAASTLGGASALRAQGTAGRAQAQQPQLPPFPLGNGEAPALQFQPYPGGTGAVLERLARERGRAAFDRAEFSVPKWSGTVPSAPEDLPSSRRIASRRC